MPALRSLFLSAFVLAASGCASFVAESHGSRITHRLHHYIVDSPDHAISLSVGDVAGAFRKDLSLEDVSFVNHEFLNRETYGARIGFYPAVNGGTGLTLMNEEGIKRRKSMDGEQKLIAHQRLARVGEWDVLFFSYPMVLSYAGVSHPETIQTMDAVRRIGKQCVYVEHSVSYPGDHSASYEDLLGQMLVKHYRVYAHGPRADQSSEPAPSAVR